MTIRYLSYLSMLICAVATALGIIFLKDNYVSLVYYASLACFLLLFIKKLLHIINNQDIFSPSIILPTVFTIVAIMGSIGNKDISVLYIAKIDNFKWYYYLIAIIFYFIGIYIANKRNICTSYTQWDPNIAKIPLIAMFTVAVISTALFYMAKGGIPLLSKDVNVARFKGTHGIVNILPYFNRWFVIVTLLSFICIFLLKRQKQSNNKLYWSFVCFSVCFLTLGGGRQFVQIFFIGIVAYHYLVKRLRLKYLILSFILVISLFAFFGYLRTKSTLGSETIQKQLTRIEYPSYLPAWTAPPYVYCRIIAEVFNLITVKVPHDISYQGGKFTFGDFLTFLPGSRKRPDFIFTDEILGGDTSVSGGTALSFMSVFYLDFGVSGIMFGFFIVGATLQSVYRRAIISNNSKYIAIYCLLLFYSVLGIYGNALFTPIATWEFMSILMFDFFVTKYLPIVRAKYASVSS